MIKSEKTQWLLGGLVPTLPESYLEGEALALYAVSL
jgi:hypothetical protein